METLSTKQRFIELRAKGWSFDKIAKELNKAKQTLINWSKEYKEEIANLKALELEVIYEKHYLLKENRLNSFGAILSKIKTEIDSRDLKDISTEKLLDLFIKYDTVVKEEYVEPVFKSSEAQIEEALERQLMEELTSLFTNNRKLKVV